MKTKNRIDLIGFVGRDPEVSYRDDKTVLNARFSLATTERWTDSTGAKKERTEWHRVVFWDRLAETVAKYVHAGSLLEVEGSMQSSKYEKDGVTHTSWQVRGFDFRLLDRAVGDVVPSAPPGDNGASDEPPPAADLPL